jgi:putative transposase
MFRDDEDRSDFCNRLAQTIKRQGWICLAFCLMTTHYHLLLEVDEDTLQPGMHWLNGTYAQRFNRRAGRWGHLHGARYFCGTIEDEHHLLRAFRYIVLNPVSAGMCERPEDWLWSSYRGTAGFDDGFPFVDDGPLRDYFGSNHGAATLFLRTFVEEAVTVSRRGLSPFGTASP